MVDRFGRDVDLQLPRHFKDMGDGTYAEVVSSEADVEGIGATNETAPATDTGTSGLNGRLQRVAQRLTSLISTIGTPLQAGGAVSVSGSALPSNAAQEGGGNLANAASALGVTSGAAVTSDSNGTLQQYLRGLIKQWTAGTLVLGAGTNAVGTVTAVTGQAATATATISNGGSLSGAIDLGTNRLARIAMPSSWTAAVLTFQTSPDGVTYNDLYDAAGNEYTVQVAASHAIIIPRDDFISVRYLKIRSGTGGSPVNQGADRALTVVSVP